MKRLYSVISILIVATILFGCGKPSDVSTAHYNYAKKAIEIADAYIDYKISAEEADLQMDELFRRADELPDDDGEAASDIVFYISLLSLSLTTANLKPSSKGLDNIIYYRDEIADVISVKRRSKKQAESAEKYDVNAPEVLSYDERCDIGSRIETALHDVGLDASPIVLSLSGRLSVDVQIKTNSTKDFCKAVDYTFSVLRDCLSIYDVDKYEICIMTDFEKKDERFIEFKATDLEKGSLTDTTGNIRSDIFWDEYKVDELFEHYGYTKLTD